MASLYDAVKAENSSYVPQFVGSNYQELNQAAQTLDKRFRDNKDYSDKIAIMMANDQYLANDKGLKDRMAQSIYGSIDKIASSDKNFENSSAAVSQIARDYFTNQERIAALDNFKLAEQDKQMEMQGYSLNFGDDRNNFTTVDPTTGQPRRFNLQREKQLDQSKKMQELLGRVASDGYLVKPTGERIKIDQDIQTFIKTGYGDTVTRKKLDRLVTDLVPAYMQTDEGRQDVKILSNLKGVKDEAVINRDIADRFKALAYPQAGSNVVGQYRDFDSGDKKNTAAAFHAGTTPGAPVVNEASTYIPDPEEDTNIEKDNGVPFYYTDLDGKPLLNKDGSPVRTHQLSENAGGELVPNPQFHDKAGKPLYQAKKLDSNEINQQYTNQFNYVKDNVPDAAKGYFKNVEEYRESYKEATKNNKQIAPSGVIIQPEQQDSYKTIVEGMRGSVPVVLAGDSSPARTIDEWAESLNVAAEDIQLIPTKAHYKTPSNQIEGGAIEVQIKIKGRPKTETAYMPLNDQFGQATKIIDSTYKGSVYSGVDKFTKEKPYGAEEGFIDNPAIPLPDGTTGYLTHYTVTVPKKKGTYKPGKDLAFDAYVYQGLVRMGPDGQVVTEFEKRPRSIKNWEAGMQEVVAGQLGSMINSGQTVNVKDAKDVLPEF
jgi:hypothetical protein